MTAAAPELRWESPEDNELHVFLQLLVEESVSTVSHGASGRSLPYRLALGCRQPAGKLGSTPSSGGDSVGSGAAALSIGSGEAVLSSFGSVDFMPSPQRVRPPLALRPRSESTTAAGSPTRGDPLGSAAPDIVVLQASLAGRHASLFLPDDVAQANQDRRATDFGGPSRDASPRLDEPKPLLRPRMLSSSVSPAAAVPLQPSLGNESFASSREVSQQFAHHVGDQVAATVLRTSRLQSTAASPARSVSAASSTFPDDASAAADDQSPGGSGELSYLSAADAMPSQPTAAKRAITFAKPVSLREVVTDDERVAFSAALDAALSALRSAAVPFSTVSGSWDAIQSAITAAEDFQRLIKLSCVDGKAGLLFVTDHPTERLDAFPLGAALLVDIALAPPTEDAHSGRGHGSWTTSRLLPSVVDSVSHQTNASKLMSAPSVSAAYSFSSANESANGEAASFLLDGPSRNGPPGPVQFTSSSLRSGAAATSQGGAAAVPASVPLPQRQDLVAARSSMSDGGQQHHDLGAIHGVFHLTAFIVFCESVAKAVSLTIAASAARRSSISRQGKTSTRRGSIKASSANGASTNPLTSSFASLAATTTSQLSSGGNRVSVMAATTSMSETVAGKSMMSTRSRGSSFARRSSVTVAVKPSAAALEDPLRAATARLKVLRPLWSAAVLIPVPVVELAGCLAELLALQQALSKRDEVASLAARLSDDGTHSGASEAAAAAAVTVSIRPQHGTRVSIATPGAAPRSDVHSGDANTSATAALNGASSDEEHKMRCDVSAAATKRPLIAASPPVGPLSFRIGGGRLSLSSTLGDVTCSSAAFSAPSIPVSPSSAASTLRSPNSTTALHRKIVVDVPRLGAPTSLDLLATAFRRAAVTQQDVLRVATKRRGREEQQQRRTSQHRLKSATPIGIGSSVTSMPSGTMDVDVRVRFFPWELDAIAGSGATASGGIDALPQQAANAGTTAAELFCQRWQAFVALIVASEVNATSSWQPTTPSLPMLMVAAGEPEGERVVARLLSLGPPIQEVPAAPPTFITTRLTSLHVSPYDVSVDGDSSSSASSQAVHALNALAAGESLSNALSRVEIIDNPTHPSSGGRRVVTFGDAVLVHLVNETAERYGDEAAVGATPLPPHPPRRPFFGHLTVMCLSGVALTDVAFSIVDMGVARGTVRLPLLPLVTDVDLSNNRLTDACLLSFFSNWVHSAATVTTSSRSSGGRGGAQHSPSSLSLNGVIDRGCLRAANFSRNPISDASAFLLSEVLQRSWCHATLRRLQVEKCRFSQGGTRCLTDAGRQLSQLRLLSPSPIGTTMGTAMLSPSAHPLGTATRETRRMFQMTLLCLTRKWGSVVARVVMFGDGSATTAAACSLEAERDMAASGTQPRKTENRNDGARRIPPSRPPGPSPNDVPLDGGCRPAKAAMNPRWLRTTTTSRPHDGVKGTSAGMAHPAAHAAAAKRWLLNEQPVGATHFLPLSVVWGERDAEDRRFVLLV